MLHTSRWLAAVVFCGACAAHAYQGHETKNAFEPLEAEVRFTDDSVVRMVFVHERLEVSTKYGMLRIPAKDIYRIDFGMHWPEGLERKIALAIEQLGHDNYRTRETALKNLVAWGPYAYPQVYAATKSADPEVIKRAVLALNKIRAKHPSRNLRLRQEDVIVTPIFTVVGRITTPILRARNENFGELDLKLCKMRSVRWLNSAFETDLTIDAARYGSAPDQWMDTGFEVRSAGHLVVVASGTVDLWPQPGGGAMYHSTPQGYRGAGGAGVYLPGMLLGKIGEDGNTFAIGERYDGPALQDGRLFLHIVPSPWQNASAGSYEVKIMPKNDTPPGD